MFTGIIEEVGTVERLTPGTAGSELRIRATQVMEATREGDSICVSGVCLTAKNLAANAFSADLSPETLSRSGLKQLRPGSLVNLERSMMPSSRMGGHIVQGHVDGLGAVHALKELGDGNWWLTIEVPDEVERFCVFKGSIAIDGVSLTIAELAGNLLSVAVIPHTFENTTMRSYKKGDEANLEIDVIAKYVEKMLSGREFTKKPALTEEKLRELGY